MPSRRVGSDLISHAETINDIVKSTYVPTLQDVELDGVRIAPPKQIPWYV